MIGFSDDQLLRLAESVLEKGDLGQCRDLLRKVSDQRKSMSLLAEVTYQLGKHLVAKGLYEPARALFAESTKTHPSSVIRSLAQERSELINRITSRAQRSVIELQDLYVEVQVKSIYRLPPDMLQPEISFVGCPAAYRSGYDPQRIDPLSKLIRMIKKGVEDATIQRLGQYLASYLFGTTEVLNTADFVIPVPTHPDRETQRGYSIPRILAEEVSKTCAIPLHEEFIRTGAAVELRHVPKWYRKYAVSGAFQIGKKVEWLPGQVALVIDDVITTGSTVKEVARLLLQNGAKTIHAVALAHTEWGG